MNKIIARNVTVNLNCFLESLESSLKTRVQYNKENILDVNRRALADEEDYDLIKMEVIPAFEMNILSFTEYQEVCAYFFNTYVSPSLEAAKECENIINSVDAGKRG